MRLKFGLATLTLVFVAGTAAAAGSHVATASSSVPIPSVGCATGGQIIEPAPKNGEKFLPLNPAVAPRVAWYADAVLAPRGWHCISLVSDDGLWILVSQQPLPESPFVMQITGPRVMSANVDSTAFGRFEVAQTGARYFPRLRPFVARVMAEGLPISGGFVFHPYRGDRFLTRRPDLVEIETPPFVSGYGTWGAKGDALPVRSRVRLLYNAQEPGLRIVMAKLPQDLRDLLPVILDTTDGQPKP